MGVQTLIPDATSYFESTPSECYSSTTIDLVQRDENELLNAKEQSIFTLTDNVLTVDSSSDQISSVSETIEIRIRATGGGS